MLIFYSLLRKLFKLPSIGNKKQLLFLFSLTYIINLLWDNYAVLSKHWEYKNMLGIYIGYSPIENILFAIIYPIAVVTVYQIFEKLLIKKHA
jgi:lycopene cyclase domain-containing protein